jgi:aspartate aminotransferase-like enzyme
MTSTRKAAANKRNASMSTGPRTLGGKLRSSHNAFRHGLASPIARDPSAAANIDRLATVLATYSNDHWRIEKARGVAESHFDLARIRAARAEVLWRIGGFENCVGDELNRALNALEKIARYEQRTRSRLRGCLEAMLDP